MSSQTCFSLSIASVTTAVANLLLCPFTIRAHSLISPCSDFAMSFSKSAQLGITGGITIEFSISRLICHLFSYPSRPVAFKRSNIQKARSWRGYGKINGDSLTALLRSSGKEGCWKRGLSLSTWLAQDSSDDHPYNCAAGTRKSQAATSMQVDKDAPCQI